MTKNNEKNAHERDQRLKAALKANMAKRKAQARVRTQNTSGDEPMANNE